MSGSLVCTYVAYFAEKLQRYSVKRSHMFLESLQKILPDYLCLKVISTLDNTLEDLDNVSHLKF